MIAATSVAACARRPRPTPTEPAAASPVVRGAESGLELWWWVVPDHRPPREPSPEASSLDPPPRPVYTVAEPGTPLERALAPYLERPTPFPEDLRSLWRAHGFRVFTVPIAELDTLQASLRLAGPVHRQWFGHLPAWTDVLRGPEWEQPHIIMVGEKVEELRPGRLRLMARCWAYPVVSGAGAPAAGLKLELMPQFQCAASERPKLAMRVAQSGEQETSDFEFLAVNLAIEKLGGEPDALVIVPDAPRADWLAPIDPETATAVDEGSPPTIGEAMLSSPAVRTPSGVSPRARAMAILIPRLPNRFELLGR